jgi:hypothetical protein
MNTGSVHKVSQKGTNDRNVFITSIGTCTNVKQNRQQKLKLILGKTNFPVTICILQHFLRSVAETHHVNAAPAEGRKKCCGYGSDFFPISPAPVRKIMRLRLHNNHVKLLMCTELS